MGGGELDTLNLDGKAQICILKYWHFLQRFLKHHLPHPPLCEFGPHSICHVIKEQFDLSLRQVLECQPQVETPLSLILLSHLVVEHCVVPTFGCWSLLAWIILYSQLMRQFVCQKKQGGNNNHNFVINFSSRVAFSLFKQYYPKLFQRSLLNMDFPS